MTLLLQVRDPERRTTVPCPRCPGHAFHIGIIFHLRPRRDLPRRVCGYAVTAAFEVYLDCYFQSDSYTNEVFKLDYTWHKKYGKYLTF
jgi:hypothetical protein